MLKEILGLSVGNTLPCFQRYIIKFLDCYKIRWRLAGNVVLVPAVEISY